MLIIQLIQQCLHTTTFADACIAKEQNIFACQNGLQYRVSFLYGERMIADGAEVGLEPMIQTLDLQWDIGIGGRPLKTELRKMHLLWMQTVWNIQKQRTS